MDLKVIVGLREEMPPSDVLFFCGTTTILGAGPSTESGLGGGTKPAWGVVRLSASSPEVSS